MASLTSLKALDVRQPVIHDPATPNLLRLSLRKIRPQRSSSAVAARRPKNSDHGSTTHSQLRPSSFLSAYVTAVQTAPRSNTRSAERATDPDRYMLFHDLLAAGISSDPDELKRQIRELKSVLAFESNLVIMQMIRKSPQLLSTPGLVIAMRMMELREAFPKGDLEIILNYAPDLLLEEDVYKAVGRIRPS